MILAEHFRQVLPNPREPCCLLMGRQPVDAVLLTRKKSKRKNDEACQARNHRWIVQATTGVQSIKPLLHATASVLVSPEKNFLIAIRGLGYE